MIVMHLRFAQMHCFAFVSAVAGTHGNLCQVIVGAGNCQHE